VKFD
jgi:hypothetical protein